MQNPLSDIRPYLPQCKIAPFTHQVEGVQALVNRPYFALFDEMGAGKTLQVIIAAQILYYLGVIDRVIVLAPASVRNVWYDEEFGELAKHLWDNVPCKIIEYHVKARAWNHGPQSNGSRLEWWITNYDFIRSAHRLELLAKFATHKTMLVCDESIAIKNHKAKQTKSTYTLRQKCGRVVLLNGTPVSLNPLDLYAQCRTMHAGILECKTFYECRGRYATIMTKHGFPQIIGWRNLDDLQRRIAPHVLRRLKKDCVDLPEKLPAVAVTATLTPETWNIYKEMRDELCTWLDSNSMSTAAQAPVKAMRLAQITSGFIGGIEKQEGDEETDVPEWMPIFDRGEAKYNGPMRYIGTEKLEAFIEQLNLHLELDPSLKLLIWTRFRAELEVVYATLRKEYPKMTVGKIHGGQKQHDRQEAIRLLDPRTAPEGAATLVGTTPTGSLGLNLTAAHTVIYLSNDYSPKTRLQSEDRTHRPGQHSPVSYFDILATGPQGQRTIDHIILKALRDKQTLSTWTTAAWVKELRREF